MRHAILVCAMLLCEIARTRGLGETLSSCIVCCCVANNVTPHLGTLYAISITILTEAYKRDISSFQTVLGNDHDWDELRDSRNIRPG